jgi:hypothetical protein
MTLPRNSLATRLLVAGAVTLAGLAGSASAQHLCFTAKLDGAQEVPPNPSLATGTAFFVMDQLANTLTYEIQFHGLTSAETAAHIHGFAPPGVNAGIQLNLGTGNPKSGTWNYAAGDEASIIAGLTYVNIHTANFPGGEIRGQILLDTSSVFMAAVIDSAQEVPPNASPATGRAFFKVDTAANKMDYRIEFSNLTSAETAAHIHGYSTPGVNSGVVLNLGTGNPKVGTWNYPAGDEASILAGLAYVNIHTANFPGGEIRGQMKVLCTDPTIYCTAKSGLFCGVPSISFSGTSSVSATSGFKIGAGPARSDRVGVLLYTNGGPGNAPFPSGGHILCIGTPVRRGGPANSGGTAGPNCDGFFSLDVNEFASGNYMPGFPTFNPAAFLSMAGTQINVQWWGRDTVATGSFMSDAVQFFTRP